MPYHIEILAIKEELYEPIKLACDSLNKVQDEFDYSLPSNRLRDSAFLEKREIYQSEDLFEWLKEYRKKAGGNRPFIILVVDGFLQSKRTANLFGTSSAKEGLAVFTTFQIDQFVNDITRYCRYYLVNYGIRFFEPNIKSHRETRSCIFDFKENKREILLSLASGSICENCFSIIRANSNLNLDVKESIEKLLQVVSNQHPFSIVLKGGGVKGLAFAGALMELEKYFSFNTFAGTSAGAITAVLLGAGYKPIELLEILRGKNFNSFKDASIWSGIRNFRKTGGFYPGNEIKNWIKELIEKRISQESEVRLRHLLQRTIVYASRNKEATMVFDSHGQYQDTFAFFAAKCSMSIPYFFSPETVDGFRVYDGGIRNNFPLQRFIQDNNDKPFIGLYLKSREKDSNSWFKRVLGKFVKGSVIKELVEIITEGDEASLVDENRDKIIIIDVHTIGTTDFDLNEVQKEFLELAGRVATLRFIEKYYPDIALDKTIIAELSSRVEELKTKI